MAWLTGYNNRLKLATRSVLVDSDLINFPVGFTISSGCGANNQDLTFIFDEVGDDYTKIAITSYDGSTALPVEVEYWSSVVEKAQIWFKAPNVYSAANTDFYLYYDATASGNSNIGTNETNRAATEQVWDSNFEAVYHMNNDPSDGSGFLKDSTSNEYHGTAAGGMSTTDLINGRALDFDGGDDNVTDTDPYYLDGFTSGMTITSYVKRHTTAAYMHLTRKYVSSGDQRSWAFYFDNTDYLHMAVTELGSSNTSTSYGDTTSTSTYTDTTDYHTISTTWSTNNYPDLYYDGSSIASSDSYYAPASIYASTADLEIGCANFDGEISEIRISSIDRSTAWIKAEHYTFTDDLLFFETYYFDGYVTERSSPVSRLVCLYERSGGRLIDHVMSDASSGYYYLTTPVSGSHTIVVLDDDSGDSYNDLILGKVTPLGVV